MSEREVTFACTGCDYEYSGPHETYNLKKGAVLESKCHTPNCAGRVYIAKLEE